MLALIGVKTEVGYMRWFTVISHPHIIPPLENVHITRPHEKKTFDRIIEK